MNYTNHATTVDFARHATSLSPNPLTQSQNPRFTSQISSTDSFGIRVPRPQFRSPSVGLRVPESSRRRVIQKWKRNRELELIAPYGPGISLKCGGTPPHPPTRALCGEHRSFRGICRPRRSMPQKPAQIQCKVDSIQSADIRATPTPQTAFCAVIRRRADYQRILLNDPEVVNP